MESLLAALPALGCVVMMPAMMWLMSRGMRGNDTPPPQADPQDTEVRRLRDEVARLRADIDSDTHPSDSRQSEPAGG